MLNNPPPPADINNTKRNTYIIGATVLFLVLAIVYGLYWWLVLQYYVSTDNAYVNGNIVPVTSQISGTVIAINADDTQFVKKGQTLVKLDPIDSYVAYKQAEANIAKTIRTTHQLYVNNIRLKAMILSQQVNFEQTKNDLNRRTKAGASGAISDEELFHAQEDFKAAQGSLQQAQAELMGNEVLTKNLSLEDHPNVLSAIAEFRKAYLDYLRTTILAPVSGEVSRRSVQIGLSIAPGTPLMSIIPLEQVWVDANFKEKQVRYMRQGQPALLTADLYGSKVQYHGKVLGFAAGTGSAFALLPAQNATGNWIKVVQRLPVRIQLDIEEIKAHPLRIGLSMEVEVDTHNRDQSPMSDADIPTALNTTIYDDFNKQVDLKVKAIVDENLQAIKTQEQAPQ